MRYLLASLSLVAVGACADDPVGYSSPVGIELKAKSGDTTNSTITERKDITTESGNPYGAFTNAATTQLGGKAPSRIELDKLTLTLGAQSTNVTALEQVVSGDVDIAFLINNSNNTYDAGHVMNPKGVGPVTMDSTFNWDSLTPADQTAMLGGSFKIVLRAPMAVGFDTANADASLQPTFTFTAFE